MECAFNSLFSLQLRLQQHTATHITAQFKVKSTLFLRFILHSRKIINQTETFDLLLILRKLLKRQKKLVKRGIFNGENSHSFSCRHKLKL